MMTTPTQAAEKIVSLESQLRLAKEDYAKRKQAIGENGDLSQAGKQKELQILDQERRKQIEALAVDLREAALDNAVQIDRLKGSRDLLSREYSKWDYGRLNYEALAVQSALTLAGGDYQKIQAAWQHAKATGDAHKIKSWRDTAPALIPAGEDWQAKEKQAILDDLSAAEILVLSEEESKLEAERQFRRDNLATLARVANEVENLLSNGPVRANIVDNVFRGISADPDADVLVSDRKPGEETEQYHKRTEAEQAANLEQSKQMAAKMGVELDPLYT